MNTYLSRLCSLAFMVLVLSACGGGGGGGSSSNADGTPTAKTKPTTITVIDGYIQGAIVCVDKNKNGSCENGETKGETDRNGKVTLDIPLEDVGKYPIVAYIPADAIDLDNPKVPVGKSYTMSAPADQSAIVSPLSTLVKRLMDKGGKTTAEATAQIKLTVGDATINYMESKDAKAIRMAAKMLAKLMQDPSKLVMPSNIKDAQKQAAMMDAMLDVLPYLQTKSQQLSASGSACASDVASTDCQSALAQALSGVMQTAAITGADSGGATIRSGGRSDNLSVSLSGTYSSALGSDYSVRVLDGTSDLGVATVTESSKTWTFTPSSDLNPGRHSFTAVVVRKSDSAKGTASSAYTIELGNKVIANSSSNVLDTITLTLSNLWSNVKSVVFDIPNTPSDSRITSDLVDGQTSKTVNAPDTGDWSSISTAFKTVGNKVISVVFKDGTNGAGTTLDTRSVSVTVGQGSVTQKASISNVQDDSSGSAVTVDDGRFTKDTTPIISGTVDVALDEYYEVAVYDNGSKLTGTLTYTNNKKDWRFTPSTALTQGLHAFTAGVIRFDGLEGTQSSPARQAIILTARPSVSSATPNVLDTVTFSLSNLYSGISTVTWALDDGRAVQTSTVTNGATSISTRYGTQGNKTVTVGYRNASGLAIATDSLTVTVAEGTVSQTASITGANSSGTPISNGGRTDSLSLTLNGSYSGNALGNDYSIRVTDGGSTLGTATLGSNSATWSFNTGTLTAGRHDFKAVVVRKIDSKLGIPSDAYTVNLGNSVNAGTGSNVLDTITLTLSNLWSNVKSVVFSIPDSPSSNIGQSDLIDGQTSKTVNAPDTGVWQTITTAFKTTGNKVINLVFKDQADQEVDRSSINVNITSGTVSQKASITNVQDDSSGSAVTVDDGKATKDTTPVISGTVDVALDEYYDVAVYDNGSKLTGTLTYTNNKKDWRFTPSTALTQGLHAFTASVIRFDGLEGTQSSPARQAIILTARPSFSPTTPNVLDTVTFSLSNLYSGISTVTWALDDGRAVQTSTVTNGATSISTRYGTQGNKTVTVGYRNASGLAIATDSLSLQVAQGTVSQTATITSVNSVNGDVANGGQSNDLRLSLSGTYSALLENNYDVHVFDGATDLGIAAVNESSKTWTFYTVSAFSPGPHRFTAVVMRSGDDLKGTPSSAYTVNLGNSVNAGTGSNVLDTITLTLSNLWSNVKSVVFSIPDSPSSNIGQSDLIDGQTSKTVTASDNGVWSSITTAFKTTGNKVINLVFKDQADQEVDRSSINVNITSGTVSQKASITNVQDDSSGSAVTVDDGKATKDTTPVISGTVDVALDEYYDVAVYDNGSKLTGNFTYTNNKKDWRFTPRTALTQGMHAFTAGVIRFDGLEGTQSSPARQAIVLTARPSFSPTNPNVLDTVTFSLSNLYSGISTVSWYLDDGMGGRSSTVTNGATSISTKYRSQGSKTVTYGYSDATGRVIASDSLTLQVAQGTVSQTATITSVNSVNGDVANGGQSNDLRLSLSGTYSALLENNYDVHVFDGATDLGIAAVNESSKTWTFYTVSAFSPGPHRFTAVVMRSGDDLKGTPSSAYTVNLGNSVSATHGSNVLDTITLTLSNIWNSIKSVVFNFSDDSGDLRDGQTSKTVNAPDTGDWSSISTAFKTVGNKVISVVFKDGTGTTLDTRSVFVPVGGSVTQKASIANVQDDSSDTPVDVLGGANTTDTTPLISGTVDVALDEYYDVAVYDNGSKLTGTLTYTNNKKDWRFTPSTALTQGLHAFTASVIRFDGLEGTQSSPARQAIILTARPSVSPTTPNVLDTVTFSLSNLYSGISTVTWALDDGSSVQTSTVTDGATSISTRYGTQGDKTVTVGYRNASGLAIATDSLTVTVGEGTVSQTASITGASAGGTTISDGGRTDSLTLTLSGSYGGNALGTDYSIRVLDNGRSVGTATLAADAGLKTWSLTSGTLTAGSHDFKAVVVRNSDGIKGTASSAYTVNLGNSVNAGSGSNVFDTITLTLSNIWSNVKSVVFGIPNTPSNPGIVGDLVDGQTSKTVNVSDNGVWQTITTAFKTTGSKLISLVFKDQSGQEIDRSSITVGVGQGSVSQTASISSVKDHATPAPVEIAEGAVTTDTTPVISGTVNTALSTYYNVAVFDSGSKLTGQLTYTNNRKDWSFTPSTPLSQALHSLTAKVVRFDGLEGTTSTPRTVNIGQANLSYSPANPKVSESVTLAATGMRGEISTVTWDFGDGSTLLTRPVNGSTSVTHTYGYDGSMAVTVTYKDINARTLGSDNVVLRIDPVVAPSTELSWSATISAASNYNDSTPISNGGRLPAGGRLALSGVATADPRNVFGYYMQIQVNGETPSWGNLQYDALTGQFTYAHYTGPQLSGIRNFKVRLVSNVNGKVSPWSSPYKVIVGGNNSVNLSQVNAWEDFVLSVNGIWRDVRQVLVRLSDTDADMGNNLASSSKEYAGGLTNTSFQISNAYKTPGSKNIIVEYKDANGISLGIDSVSLTVNLVVPISQTAKVTGLQGDVNSSVSSGKFTLTGSLSAPIGQFYSVKVYDNNAIDPLAGTISFNSERTTWTFIPDAILASGSHVFKPVVVRADGASGPPSTESFSLNVPSQRFTKIASDGQPLSNQSAYWSDTGSQSQGTQWDCVRDNTTGLMWETKTNNPDNLRYNNHSYSWYLSNKDGSGVSEGSDNGGSCTGLGDKCNTEAFIKAVNDARLCGKSDWRISSDSETSALINLGIASKKNTYFPHNNESDYGNISNGEFGGFQLTADRYYNSDVPNFGPFELMLVRGDFLRTAAIQSIADSGGVISNPGQTTYNSLRLTGNYSDVLGSNFKVALYDNNKRLGLVTTNDANKTWSYQLDNLAGGAHAFKVVVEASDRSAQGTPSNVYGLNANTTANASNVNPNLWETIRFWIVNTLDAVKTVVWNFGAGVAKQTANVANNISTSVDYFFQTDGVKTVIATLKDTNGQTLGTQNLNINVNVGTVSQTANIVNVQDDSSGTAVTVDDGKATKDTTPVISGTVDGSLTQYYDVAVFDNGIKLTGQLTYTNNRKDWSFTPSDPLTEGSHVLEAAVLRFDGLEGAKSSPARNAFVLTASPSFTPSSPNVLDTVNFNVSNLISGISTVTWDFGDGRGEQTSGVTNRATSISTRYNTQGSKTVTVTYKNSSDAVLATDTLPVSVAIGTVSQTVNITGVSSGGTPISSGDKTNTMTLTLNGTYTGNPLGSDYSIRIFDGDNFIGEADKDDTRKTWTYTRIGHLGNDLHRFNAVVMRNIDSKRGLDSGTLAVKLLPNSNNSNEREICLSDTQQRVDQTADITDVQDESTNPAVSISKDSTSFTTRPLITGNFSQSLNNCYSLEIHINDSNEPLGGEISYNVGKSSWSFKPLNQLKSGLNSITASVKRFDGVTGLKSSNSWKFILGEPQFRLISDEFKTYDKTECIKDNYTGLIWEGKTESGLRKAQKEFTNFDALNYSADEVNLETNAQGYANRVNADALCGFTDWRLPTLDELRTLTRYTFGDLIPWQPNITQNWYYWSSTAASEDARQANFIMVPSGSYYGIMNRSDYVNLSVILVRDDVVSVGNSINKTFSFGVLDNVFLKINNILGTAKSVVIKFVSNASTAITELADGIATKTANLLGGSWDMISTAFNTPGKKTITIDFKDELNGGGSTVSTTSVDVNIALTSDISSVIWSLNDASNEQTQTVTDQDSNGTVLDMDTSAVIVDEIAVSQKVDITGASSDGSTISSGGRASTLPLTLSGTYTGNELGSSHSIRLMDGNTYLGSATLGANPAAKTWSFSTGSLARGSHEFKAVIVRNSDMVHGKFSNAYKIKVGNIVSASASHPVVLETITLSLSNIWNNVKSVVFSIPDALTELDTNGDVVWGPSVQTVNAPANGVWQVINLSFKTVGSKIIDLVFKDDINGGGNTVDTDNLAIKVPTSNYTVSISNSTPEIQETISMRIIDAWNVVKNIVWSFSNNVRQISTNLYRQVGETVNYFFEKAGFNKVTVKLLDVNDKTVSIRSYDVQVQADQSSFSLPKKENTQVIGFTDNDDQRADLKNLNGFQGMVKFAQSHTIDPNGNEAKHMPSLVPLRDTLLMFIPQQPVTNGSIKVKAMSGGIQLGTLTMSSPEYLPATDQPLPDPRGTVNYSTKAWSVKLPANWMQAGLSLQFVRTADGTSGELAANDIEFGASTSLTLQSLRLGMLTQPVQEENNWWELQPGISLLDYYQKIPVTKMTIGYYLPVYFSKVVLPNGKIYTTASEKSGGAYEGDMREYIAKLLVSHGINFASFGLNSSQADELSPFTGRWDSDKRYFTQITFHLAQGNYANGVKGHGLSGGNGMATLFSSQGNEFSHEIGHNFGLAHYISYNFSQPLSEYSAFHHPQSSWGYDAYRNRMIGNIGWDFPENGNVEGKKPPVYRDQFYFNWDPMSGGEPRGVVSKFTHHTGWAASQIQKFLENGSEIDVNGTYLRWNAASKSMEPDQIAKPRPARIGIPVMTLIGYYDPQGSLPTTIYPPLWGSHGNTFAPSTSASPDDCRLRAYTSSDESNFSDYALENQRFDTPQMNKFHVNFAMDALPVRVSILCKDNNNQFRTLDTMNITPPVGRPRQAMTVGGGFGISQALKQVKNFDAQIIGLSKPYPNLAQLEEKISNTYGQVTENANQMVQGAILRKLKQDGTFDYLLQTENSDTSSKILLGNTGSYINFLPEPFASDKLTAVGFEARLAEYYQTPSILSLEGTDLNLLTQGKVASNIISGIKNYYLLLRDLGQPPYRYQVNTDYWIYLGTESSLSIAINPKAFSQKNELENYLTNWYKKPFDYFYIDNRDCAYPVGTLYKTQKPIVLNEDDVGKWLYLRQKVACRSIYNIEDRSNDVFDVLGILRRQ